MTGKLYYTDPTNYEWETVITKIEKIDDYWGVTLAETAFYPEGGGQPRDFGTIDGIDVFNLIKNGEEITHLISEKPKNTTVYCQIDRTRRIKHTQHHSGQHLLSAICLEMFGYETLSVHIGENTATVDFNVPSITNEQLGQLEQKVNEEIWNNRKVNTFYINKRDADRYSLIKVPNEIDKLRIVEIEGIEYNACAGTHVQQTSQIGMLKLLKTERVRGNTRVYFVCGFLLLNDYTEKFSLFTNLSRILSTGGDSILQQVEKIKTESKEKDRMNTELFHQYAELLVEKLTNKYIDGYIIEQFANLTMKQMTIITSHLIENGAKIVLLSSKYENRISLVQNGTIDFHFGQFVKEHASTYSGKGGGNATKAQVTFNHVENMNEFLDFCKTKISLN